MLILLSSCLITAILAAAVMIISSLLAKKSTQDREKSSPFECGFEPKASARIPFSLRFFLIAIIFLIFDVEITLLLPIASLIKTTNITSITSSATFFLLVLLGGLYYEWNQGALNWSE